jgi:SAM-dependent methyltransferase
MLSKWTKNPEATLPVGLRRLVWNLKYGLLKYPRWQAPDDVVGILVRELKDDSRILDLGCGAGGLLRALRSGGWRGHYCGVDISRQAIVEAADGDTNSSWRVSDIESFSTDETWDAVCFIESINYVDAERAPAILTRFARSLKGAGFMLVRSHDFQKHHAYEELISASGYETLRIDSSLIRISPR